MQNTKSYIPKITIETKLLLLLRLLLLERAARGMLLWKAGLNLHLRADLREHFEQRNVVPVKLTSFLSFAQFVFTLVAGGNSE